MYRPRSRTRTQTPLSSQSSGAEPPIASKAKSRLVVVIIPCYKEKINVVLDTMYSLLRLDYPPSHLHVFLSFDGFENEPTFHKLVSEFGGRIQQTCEDGITTTTERHGCRLTISMFRHGGKPHIQGRTIQYIRDCHPEYLDNSSAVSCALLDSDTIIPTKSVSSLVSFLVSHLCYLSRYVDTQQGRSLAHRHPITI